MEKQKKPKKPQKPTQKTPHLTNPTTVVIRPHRKGKTMSIPLSIDPKIGVYVIKSRDNKKAYIGVTTDGDRVWPNARAALRRGSKTFPYRDMLRDYPADYFAYEMIESFQTPDAEAIEAAALRWGRHLGRCGVSLYNKHLAFKLGAPSRAWVAAQDREAARVARVNARIAAVRAKYGPAHNWEDD
jgi:hypothetical protein